MNALRLAATALALTTLPAMFLATASSGCADSAVLWECINPATGKLTGAPYDPNHYVNGVFDPCHCYDPGGPEPQCPIVIDAGTDAK